MEKFFSISKNGGNGRHDCGNLALLRPHRTSNAEQNGQKTRVTDIILRLKLSGLNTIKALRSMDLTLSEIRNILEYDDLKKIAEALKQTEAKADKKIAELRDAKKQIRRARNFYESKLYGNAFSDNIFLKRVSSPRHSFVGQAERPHCRQSVELSQAFLRPFDARNQGRFLV